MCASHNCDVLKQSAILSDRLHQHPAWVDALQADLFVEQAKTRSALEASAAQAIVHSGGSTGLRRFKYYELCRLMLRAWSGGVAHQHILHEWSDVADICITQAFAESFPQPNAWSIIALGKLGSQELNISSDVDLLLLHSADAEIQHAAQYVRRFTQLLQERTADGFAFRVDWDLRPEGKQGAPALSLRAAELYYESRGSTWERMMLLRARHVAGNAALSEQFLSMLKPFMYSRHVSTADIESCRQMKMAMQQEHAAYQQNLKFSPGGIREIEFIVHALQMLHGGRLPTLQTTSTLDALAALADTGLLATSDAKQLTRAYRYFREVENMIQVEHERHTHQLPSDPEAVKRLAARCGESIEELHNNLVRHQSAVHTHFSKLFQYSPIQQQFERAIAHNVESASNEEERLDALSWSKQQQLKNIAQAHINGALSTEQCCERLSWLAGGVLEHVCQLAATHCAQRGLELAPYALLGFGSFGAYEMDYGSDLDLVFLYDGSHEHSANMARFCQRIMSLLSLPLRYGRLYAVDQDLRPSGRGGVLVSSVDAFMHYQHNEAALWEHQALLRARVVKSPPHLATKLHGLLHGLPFVPRARAQLADKMHALREQAQHSLRGLQHVVELKLGKGGIADIETITQFLQMQHGDQHTTLKQGNTWRSLRHLEALGYLDAQSAQRLLTHYSHFRTILAHSRLATQSSVSKVDTQSPAFASLCTRLQLGTPEQARRDVEMRMAAVTEIYSAKLRSARS